MLEQKQDAIRSAESARLRRVAIGGPFRKVVSRYSSQPITEVSKFIEAYRVSVERCFILSDFNEELPLYILDLEGTLLILFGQWLFDPHTLRAPQHVFESWVCDHNFFGKFSLRCSDEHGVVLELKVEGVSLVQAERIPVPIRFKRLREYQLLTGASGTLISDLENADLIHHVGN